MKRNSTTENLRKKAHISKDYPPDVCFFIQIKSANALTRQLKPYRALLKFEYSIRSELERSAKGRTLHLTKISNDYSDDSSILSTDTVNTVME